MRPRSENPAQRRKVSSRHKTVWWWRAIVAAVVMCTTTAVGVAAPQSASIAQAHGCLVTVTGTHGAVYIRASQWQTTPGDHLLYPVASRHAYCDPPWVPGRSYTACSSNNVSINRWVRLYSGDYMAWRCISGPNPH